MASSPRSSSREEGAVAVITAIILTVLIALMAFVVDFGMVRADVRESQSAADAASQAGVGVLGEGGTFEEACLASVDYLAVNLGISLSSGFCDDFASPPFEDSAIPVDCQARAASSLDATSSPSVIAPVYAEETVGDYTVRIQMPVRHVGDGSGATDPVLDGQNYDAGHDGDDPCKRIAVSIRRSRDLIFGSFAGGTGPVSGFADAVSRYRIETGIEDISSLIVLDPTGCETLFVTSNNGRLLVENTVNDDGELRPGLITVDSTGTACGNNKYVIRTGGSGARVCAGVDSAKIVEVAPGDYQIVAPGFCDSDPDTLRTPSVRTGVSTGDPYGKSVSSSEITNRNVEPVPTHDDPVTRRPADHEWNCRDAVTNAATGGNYPKSAAGDEWHPLYEDIESCANGRAANLDNLAEDLAEGAAFSAHSSWTTVSGAGCSVPAGGDITIGNGSKNLYFDCGVLDIKGTARLFTDQYIVVRGWIDASNASTNLSVNVDGSGGNLEEDAVMVIQGKSSGNPGYGLSIGSSAVANINRTAVYLHTGAMQVNANDMRWTAPEDTSYAPLDEGGEAVDCDDSQSFGSYDLPSPECFQKLAMWSNNTGDHRLRGGGQLDVAGVFFAPYAGRQGTSSFTLAGDVGQRLTKAQFFTYRFRLSGGSLLSMRPDPDYNIFTSEPVLSLIR